MDYLLQKLFIPLMILLFHPTCNQPLIGEDDQVINNITSGTNYDNPLDSHEDPTSIISFDESVMKVFNWGNMDLPDQPWPDETTFGDDLFVDSAYDPEAVSLSNNQLRFYIDPVSPPVINNFNYRSEIHTAPWPIQHPLGTEQWLGWEYTFGEDYVIDPTAPITIFQNHNGVNGLSPAIELEIAGLNNPSPAQGGEIQVVNEAASERIVYPVRPEAGDKLEVVVHVIYGVQKYGLLQVWLNGTLYYNKRGSTVYEDHLFGGNNKWGVYHHMFNNSADDVQSSLNIGAGRVELFIGPLRILTRTPDHPEYKLDAYHLVRPEN